MDQAVTFSAAAITIVGILLGGMATAVGALWLDSRKSERKRESAAADLIRRIRQLEDARIEDATKHGEEYRHLCERQITVQQQTNSILREVLSVLRARPCMGDREQTPRPHNLPEVQTDTIRKTKDD